MAEDLSPREGWEQLNAQRVAEGERPLCTACRPPENVKNWVHGHIFVGWGFGWAHCPTCGGTGIEPEKEEAHPDCTRCKHFLDPKDSDERLKDWGYGGACVHPTNYHRTVYLIAPSTSRCGRFEESNG